jgi:hypothetical protein
MTVPYQQVLSRRASPFMRWTLSPFLLLFAVVFYSPIPELLEKQNQGGVAAFSILVILSLAGLLALWGVPLVGRIVTGIIAMTCCWYVVDQCIIKFNGSWSWGGRKSAVSPVNSILAFLVFGLPCCIYTIFGRFTVRKEPEMETDADDDFDDGEFDHKNQTDD